MYMTDSGHGGWSIHLQCYSRQVRTSNFSHLYYIYHENGNDNPIVIGWLIQIGGQLTD